MKKNKERATWLPYYERVTKNKKAYNRKRKHKGRGWENENSKYTN